MSDWFLTGMKGSGKGIVAIAKIQEYLKDRKIVATNLDLNLENLVSPRRDDTRVYRLPDQPTIEALQAMPLGNESYDDSRNGLLVLDECGTWLNSRSWNDKGRKKVIDWFLHSRKYGWDTIWIVQDIDLIDAQARKAFCEHLIIVQNFKKIPLPFFGKLTRLMFGKPVTFPEYHRGKVILGQVPTGLVVDVWGCMGKQYWSSYDTRQIFLSEEDGGAGFACMLTPWHLKGRYMPPRSFWRPIKKFLFLIIDTILDYQPPPKPTQRVSTPAAHQMINGNLLLIPSDKISS